MAAAVFPIVVHPPNHDGKRRSCGTMDYHYKRVQKDANYRTRQLQVEKDIQTYQDRYPRQDLRSGIIRVPVVVHVVHRTATENISDAQIQSQIAVLNQDFRRSNADAVNTPAPFAAVAVDTRIEFALAVRDPNCQPTTGITRTSTTVVSFTDDNAVKSNATGGHDPWPRDKYLNMWVCSLAGGLLGYSTFPGDAAAVDGVVILNTAFGNTGTAAAPFNLGRTATHEIGHWLGLLHIWGDDGGACSGSDNVNDTPNQGDYRAGNPSFPHISCNNGPNVDMFMNYMDYTDDAAMNLFTFGQAARMDAVLHTVRSAILASDALVPDFHGADLWSKDNVDDHGAEPASGVMYISDDIWVRRQNDGLANRDHQNPEYRAPGEPSNYVYVRVRNRGCAGPTSVQSGNVLLYWAKASTGLSWPKPWDGSVTLPALMGSPIGQQPVSVAGGDEVIVFFPWYPPNPADYASFGLDQSHFCLLSRIETAPNPPYGMTTAEGSDLWANVLNNNNIVWKNITVVDEEPGGARTETVAVCNFSEKEMLIDLRVRLAETSIFQWGRLVIHVGKALTEAWPKKESDGVILDPQQIGTFWVQKDRATLCNVYLPPRSTFPLTVEFLPATRKPVGARVFAVDIIQQLKGGKNVGGQRFILKTRPDPKTTSWDKAPIKFDGVGWFPPNPVVTPTTVGCSCHK